MNVVVCEKTLTEKVENKDRKTKKKKKKAKTKKGQNSVKQKQRQYFGPFFSQVLPPSLPFSSLLFLHSYLHLNNFCCRIPNSIPSCTSKLPLGCDSKNFATTFKASLASSLLGLCFSSCVSVVFSASGLIVLRS